MARPAPIRIEGLNHYYGRGELKQQVLFDVSTEVQAGEIVIVTGPAGSGKTTLLTLVGALRSAQDGSVRILGEELRTARPATIPTTIARGVYLSERFGSECFWGRCFCGGGGCSAGSCGRWCGRVNSLSGDEGRVASDMISP